MLRDLVKNFGKKILGSNLLLSSAVRHCFMEGKYFKAAAMALYVLPLKKSLDFPSKVMECSFIPSVEYYSKIQDLLHIAKTEGFELVRIGRSVDGGYALLKDFDSDDKTAYSFGIAKDVSWDKDMASRGYDVFMYDHTIDGLPEENPRFHWSKLGIADGQTHDARLKTLDELIKINHHEDKHNMILKMDVEGAEWGFLSQTSSETLSHFSQIVFELHGMNEPRNYERIPQALQKLNITHQLIHIHRINHGFYIKNNGKIFCNQIEALYVRRDKYSLLQDYDAVLPTSIDMRNIYNVPDLPSEHWNTKAELDDKCSTVMLVMNF